MSSICCAQKQIQQLHTINHAELFFSGEKRTCGLHVYRNSGALNLKNNKKNPKQTNKPQKETAEITDQLESNQHWLHRSLYNLDRHLISFTIWAVTWLLNFASHLLVLNGFLGLIHDPLHLFYGHHLKLPRGRGIKRGIRLVAGQLKSILTDQVIRHVSTGSPRNNPRKKKQANGRDQ